MADDAPAPTPQTGAEAPVPGALPGEPGGPPWPTLRDLARSVEDLQAKLDKLTALLRSRRA